MRRTDLEITDSVVRLYYGAVLARQLHQVGKDTLARMGVTLELTESLYKNGAGKVNKTDYLDNVVMVETIRSTVASLPGTRPLPKPPWPTRWVSLDRHRAPFRGGGALPAFCGKSGRTS